MAYVHGGELVARALAAQGVNTIYTLCGGHVAPIYDGCLNHQIQVIDFRHEQAAAHAADAHARLTRNNRARSRMNYGRHLRAANPPASMCHSTRAAWQKLEPAAHTSCKTITQT